MRAWVPFLSFYSGTGFTGTKKVNMIICIRSVVEGERTSRTSLIFTERIDNLCLSNWCFPPQGVGRRSKEIYRGNGLYTNKMEGVYNIIARRRIHNRETAED